MKEISISFATIAYLLDQTAFQVQTDWIKSIQFLNDGLVTVELWMGLSENEIDVIERKLSKQNKWHWTVRSQWVAENTYDVNVTLWIRL